MAEVLFFLHLLQEIFKFCGGNKQFAADLMFDLDEDQDGMVTARPQRKRKAEDADEDEKVDRRHENTVMNGI